MTLLRFKKCPRLGEPLGDLRVVFSCWDFNCLRFSDRVFRHFQPWHSECHHQSQRPSKQKNKSTGSPVQCARNRYLRYSKSRSLTRSLLSSLNSLDPCLLLGWTNITNQGRSSAPPPRHLAIPAQGKQHGPSLHSNKRGTCLILLCF